MVELPQPNVIQELRGCMIVNKPGGLLTQGPPGIDSLELRIKQYVKTRDEKRGKVYLGVPHRLDRPASGVMLFARNVRVAKRISAQFQDRSVKKKYWVVVEGLMEADAGSWHDVMKKLPDQAKSVITATDEPGAQEARLHFQVVARSENKSWLEIQLETGRTHQIRLQASHRGHPVVGDQLYGAQMPFGPPTFDVRKRWIALHAREIGFEHPITHDIISKHADLWSPWSKLEFDFPQPFIGI